MAKQPAAGDIEKTVTALKQVQRDSAMAMAPLEFERDRLQQEKDKQEYREEMIAECHEVIGRIQGFKAVGEFADVGKLVWLKQIKESKIYKDLPNIGTWDNFCNYIGLSRSKVDEDLTNMDVFGNTFLTTVGNLGLGYKDLRKLRQLTYDGSVIIDAEAETITIDGQIIPFNEEHTDEVQAAIESIISNNADLNKKVDRLLNDVKGIVKEETKGLKIEKDALLAEVKRLKVYDPIDKDREWSIAMMDEVRKAAVSLEVTIQKFVIDPRLDGDRPLQAQVWAHLTGSISQLEDLDARMREAFFSNEG